jgi:hypothetical protein
MRNRGTALPSHGYDGGGGEGGYDTGSGYGGFNGGYGGDVYGGSPTNTFKDKVRSRTEPWKNPLILYGVAAFFVITTLYYRSSGNGILKALNVKTRDAAVLMIQGLEEEVKRGKFQLDKQRNEIQRTTTQEITRLEKEKKKMQTERDALRIKYQGPDKAKEDTRISMREAALKEQLSLLLSATKREAKRTVLERFGPGPHQVKFTFAAPNADYTVYTDYTFVVELAPLEVLPHAVHLFLEQVAHKLWDGCYFYLNGPHVLQGGPQSFEEDETPIPKGESARYPALKPFKDKGLETLAFPEYSTTFPHQTWTLGYTGRPGGPDFYINKVDNSKAHGPGGQFQHALNEQVEADLGEAD